MTFNHVGLLGRREHPGVEEIVSGLLNLLDDRGLQVTIEDRLATLSHFEKREMESRDQIGAMVDLAIVIGGDGSLLSAARTLVKHDTPVIGVNRGRLGFLTDVSPDELIDQVSAVLDGDFISEQRFLLDTEVWRGEQVIGRGEALNDIVVNSGASAQMIEFELSIDGEFVYRLNADGLLVATPTGSTAYSLSAGGPIMYPGLDALVLVPMFPHSLTSRPIAVSGQSEIRIDVVSRNDIHPPITCDGQISITALPGDSVRIRKKARELTLLHPRGIAFTPAAETNSAGQMPSLNSAPLAIQRAPATFSLVVVTSVCFLLFYPLHWVGMLELFNFVPFRAAGGYVAFGEWGDWWRLVTPTLIHFGWLHVVFNCLWLWEFGQRIEHRLGAVNLLGLYVVSAMLSNYSQYWWEGPSIFGGMSGVVYAFMGLIMATQWRRPGWIAPPPMAIFAFMMIWLVIGMVGSMEFIGAGAIANGAHVGGLLAGWILGVVISGLPTLFGSR